MRFPKYWAKGRFTGGTAHGKEITVWAFGWSSWSLAEAQRVGVQRAQRALESGIGSKKKKDYEYGDAPFREEVVQRIVADSKEIGIISRNRYGSLVLNTAGVMFVDVDLPAIESEGFVDAVLTTFSSKRRKAKKANVQRRAINRIEAWASGNPSKSFRLYETHSGFRLLFTDELYDPTGSETGRMLEELGADRLYRRLTQKQDCFRARLTPKPWRCGAERPPSAYPWDNAEQESKYRLWERGYSETAKRFCTCGLRKVYGLPGSRKEITKIVEIHDAHCLGRGGPLA